MPRKPALSAPQKSVIASRLVSGESARSLAREFRVSPATITKLKTKTRARSEFPDLLRKAESIIQPNGAGERYSWDLESIRNARDSQLRGDFKLPVALATMLRTDDAIFNARRFRVAPVSALGARLVSAGGVRGDAVQKRASECVSFSRSEAASLVGTLADHGVAIIRITPTVDEAGTFIHFALNQWPLEFVKEDKARRVLTTEVYGGPRVDIVHGDGTWIVVKRHAFRPWTQDAALIALAFQWPAHAEAIKDWALTSNSHGLVKLIGELPTGTALTDKDGALTTEAVAFLNLLRSLVSGNSPAGIRPPGSKTDFVANNSTAYQVFENLVTNRERSITRTYLGTDAILGSTSDAPGVDIAALFGVASTILQGDLNALEDALYSGAYAPWTAINYGDSRLAPRLRYLAPDPDAARKSAEENDGLTKLLDLLKRLREEGMQVDQKVVDAIAARLGVSNPPQLATAPATPAEAPTE